VLHQLPTRATPPANYPVSAPRAKHDSPFSYLVTSSRRPAGFLQKPGPFFSITYTLFSIHNFVHPLYFVSTAHSLPKTPGGGGPLYPKFLTVRITLIESHCFANARSNPFRILLFREMGGGSVSFLIPCFATSYLANTSGPELHSAACSASPFRSSRICTPIYARKFGWPLAFPLKLRPAMNRKIRPLWNP